MTYELPALPFEKNALEPYMSAETLDFHYGKHHQTYVNNLNNLIQDSPLNGKPLEEVIQNASGGLYNNAAQTFNHTFFWQCLKPTSGGGEPKGALLNAINQKWGNFTHFKTAFAQSAAANFGSGWTWLVKKSDGSLEIVNMGAAGNPLTENNVPILCLDVWEHAYYIDYRNARPKFIESFLEHLVNWDFAEQNFA